MNCFKNVVAGLQPGKDPEPVTSTSVPQNWTVAFGW